MEEEVPPGALGRESPSVSFLRAGEGDAWELAKASHGLGTVGRPLQVGGLCLQGPFFLPDASSPDSGPPGCLQVQGGSACWEEAPASGRRAAQS